MLDFGALEEAQAAVDTVRHRRVEQRRLDHPALRIATVEHCDFLARDAFAHQLPHLLDHPLRLGEIAGRFVHAHRLSRALFGTQVLAEAIGVVADQRIGRVEDVAVAAVVLLQLDLPLHIELADEIRHVADACAAKRIDALVVVADRDHAVAGTGHEAAFDRLARQHLDPGVLELVGVLKLIDQDVTEAPLVVLAHRIVVTQQLVAAQHQLTEIDHTFALTLFFVQLVKLDLLAVVITAHFDVARPVAVFLRAGDEPLRLLGRKTLVVDVVLLHQPLDGRELVLRVEDLKGRREIG